MDTKNKKRFLTFDNIISRLAFALILSILISVLLAQVITSLGGQPDYRTNEPLGFIHSTMQVRHIH
jgi:hypothetical protein